MVMNKYQKEAEEMYPLTPHDPLKEGTSLQRAFDLLQQEAYLAALTKHPPVEWVDAKERPLVIREGNRWITVNDVSFEFLAAVPFNDKNRPNEKNLWWIKHCVIEDEVGLCVVGDDDNERAGWEIDDVTHYIPLPAPPITNTTTPTT